MPFAKIETKEIRVYPLHKRKSKTNIESIAIHPDSTPGTLTKYEKDLVKIADRIKMARKNNRAIILAFGAHLVKNGLAPVVIRMMQEGWLTHLATNGAGSIHDWEFAWLGRSEEDVRNNVSMGTFGTWEETGKFINLAVQIGAIHDMGYGESVGKLIDEEKLEFPDPDYLKKEIKKGVNKADCYFAANAELLRTMSKFKLKKGEWNIEHPYKHYSIFANAYKLRIPLTVHPGIGYDIIYNNPFANGAALGRAAHTDFLIMVKSISNLTDGVFLSIGSAIMAPQIFEKSLSCANNIKIQKERDIIQNHLIVVNDLQKSKWKWHTGEPPKESSDYYLRYLKTFYRMNGEVKYIAADNRTFLLNLYHKLK